MKTNKILMIFSVVLSVILLPLTSVRANSLSTLVDNTGVAVANTSSAFQRELDLFGIETNASSRVSIIVGNSNQTAYLVTTSVDDNKVENDILLVFNENGIRENVSLDVFFTESSRGSGSGTVHPYNWFRLTASGTYTSVSVTWHSATLHQPSNVSFYYSPYTSGTISSFSTTVVFTTGGIEYSLLSEDVLHDGDPYSYAISITKTNPQTNTIYRQYGTYSTAYGIDVSCGGIFYGEHINVSGTCNGNYYEDGFSF